MSAGSRATAGRCWAFKTAQQEGRCGLRLFAPVVRQACGFRFPENIRMKWRREGRSPCRRLGRDDVGPTEGEGLVSVRPPGMYTRFTVRDWALPG